MVGPTGYALRTDHHAKQSADYLITKLHNLTHITPARSIGPVRGCKPEPQLAQRSGWSDRGVNTLMQAATFDKPLPSQRETSVLAVSALAR